MAEKERTIVYIEDDRASRMLVQRVLSNKGYVVHVASDGLEGINLAKQTRPQLILMDINLPNMGGREITTRIRSLPNFSNTPIVALTANSSPGSRKLALAAGCTGFLTKPIDVASFPSLIKDFLEGRIEPLSEEERSTHLQLHAENAVESLERTVRELEQANRRLIELDRLKSDFIVLVSHELRTPMTLISGYAHLLEAEMRAPDDHLIPAKTVAGIAGGLKSGIDRMQEVIGEIISISRIASGTLDLALGKVELAEVMAQVAGDFKQICLDRQISLEVRDLDKLPSIEGDAKQLKSAFDNVVGNAIKYTPDQGSVSIDGRRLDDFTITLRIKDTGIGIPPEEHKHIFDQFYVLGAIEHHSTSKSSFQGGGLGIGLAITKGIVDAHYGRIWVESERRDPKALPGSIFHILLPIRQPGRNTGT